MKDFRKKTIEGISWSAINQLGQQTLRLVISIILARMLSPREFGLVAMITVFTYFAVMLPDFLRFLVQWISNDIARILMVVYTIAMGIAAIYAPIGYKFIRIKRFNRKQK